MYSPCSGKKPENRQVWHSLLSIHFIHLFCYSPLLLSHLGSLSWPRYVLFNGCMCFKSWYRIGMLVINYIVSIIFDWYYTGQLWHLLHTEKGVFRKFGKSPGKCDLEICQTRCLCLFSAYWELQPPLHVLPLLLPFLPPI